MNKKQRAVVRPSMATDDIAVQASVRQGDPLSPLIYICITDALHEGLRRNPLFDNCKTGYTFSNDAKLTVSSTGYADDTMTYARPGRINGKCMSGSSLAPFS